MKKVAGWVNPRSEASPFCLGIFTLGCVFRSRVATRVLKYITLDRYIFRMHFQHCRAYLSTFLYDLRPQVTTARTAIAWRVFLMKKVAGWVNPRSEASPFCLVIFTPKIDF